MDMAKSSKKINAIFTGKLNKMKKILFVSNTANFSKFNKPYMKWCSENGWKVDYCAPNDEVVSECDNHIVLPIPRSPFSKGSLKCIKNLQKILEKEQYDIIHCHTPMGAVIARLAARKLFQQKKVKVIYTAHGFHFYKGAPLLNWLLYYPVEKFLLRYTDVLITINKEDYDYSLKKFSKYVKVMFMNGVGVNLNRFSKVTAEENLEIRNQLGYKQDDFLITVVAELNVNKNQIMLINSLSEIRQQIPNLKVLFLGKESLLIARNKVNELGLSDTCEFLGYRKDVDLFTKISNICFSASLREGLPVNIIEAMACGKVCVCSVNRGHNSLIRDNENGLLFSSNDSSKMIENIVSIYKDLELGNRLSEQAFEDSKQYAVEKAIDFMANVYISLL